MHRTFRDGARAALCALCLGAGVFGASAADEVTIGEPLPIKVERVKPKKEKHPTLRFLKANRAFLRAELDRLREKPVESDGEARAIDPRHLLYRDLLAAASASVDSVRSEDAQREQREILASIADLAALEGQLDDMERLLGGERDRLTTLSRDFADRQITALMILARGVPPTGDPTRVAITDEDGARWEVPLSAAHVAALHGGGLAQIYHEFIEPREQVLEIAVSAAGRADDVRYVVIEPPRGQLTFLELDLDELGSASETPVAKAWVQVAEAAPVANTPNPGEASD